MGKKKKPPIFTEKEWKALLEASEKKRTTVQSKKQADYEEALYKESPDYKKKIKQDRDIKEADTEKKSEEAKYESSPERVSQIEAERETARLKTKAMLQEEHAKRGPKADYDRYLKEAQKYHKAGYDVKREGPIERITPATKDTPADTQQVYRSIATKKPGRHAESARVGADAYADSMGFAQTGMKIGADTQEVVEFDKHLNTIFNEEYKQQPGPDNIKKRMAMKKTIVKFISQHGEPGKKYLKAKGFVNKENQIQVP